MSKDGFCSLTYEERLKRFDMFSLKDRRIWGDLIETFKILNNIDKLNYEHLFELSTSVTRNNGWKLKGQSYEETFLASA